MARKNEELIQRTQKVGEGSFGIVYIGSYREHKEVGIKDIKGKLSDEALTEADILKKLTHPNIIQYIDIVQIRNQTSIIMEFVDGGSLYDYIGRTAQSSAYWRITRQIMLDVAYGMSYLHGQHIVHADLKSPNILLRHNYSAVICDFGLAKIMTDSQPVTTCYVSGTIKIEYEKNIVSFCLYRYGILVCTRTLF
jgi:serine/threonine protein kinase